MFVQSQKWLSLAVWIRLNVIWVMCACATLQNTPRAYKSKILSCINYTEPEANANNTQAKLDYYHVFALRVWLWLCVCHEVELSFSDTDR